MTFCFTFFSFKKRKCSCALQKYPWRRNICICKCIGNSFNIHQWIDRRTMTHAVKRLSAVCLSYISHCNSRTPKWNSLKKEMVILGHGSRVQSITVGKSRCKELEAAAHAASSIRSQEKMKAWSFSYQDPSPGNDAPSFRMGLPTSVTQSITHGHVRGLVYTK